MQLSKAVEKPAARSVAIKAAKDPAIQRLDSDARFARVLQAVTESAPQPDTLVWQRGAASAKIAISKKAVSIVVPTDEPGFGEYVVDRLDVLHDEFCEQRKREAAAQGS